MNKIALLLLSLLVLAACSNTPAPTALETPGLSEAEFNARLQAEADAAQGEPSSSITAEKIPVFQLEFVLINGRYVGRVKTLWNYPGRTDLLAKLTVYRRGQPQNILGLKFILAQPRQNAPATDQIGSFSSSNNDYCLDVRWYSSTGSPPPYRLNFQGYLVTYCMVVDTPPSVRLTSTYVGRGSTYSATVYQLRLSTEASDDQGVAQVELFVTDLDGNTRSLGTTTNASASWDFTDNWSGSRNFRSGNYSFKAVVTDTAGQTSSTTLVVPVKYEFVLRSCYGFRNCGYATSGPYANGMRQVFINGSEIGGSRGGSDIIFMYLQSGDIIRIVVTDTFGVCPPSGPNPYDGMLINNLSLFATGGPDSNVPDLEIPLNQRIYCDYTNIAPGTVTFDQSYTITF